MRKLILILCSALTVSCSTPARSTEETTEAPKERIVSLNGTLTEILCASGLESSIVGTDVTSAFPESIQKLPKLGHVKSLNAEGIIALSPTMVFGKKDEIKPELEKQLIEAGIKVLLFEQEYSVDGSKRLIKEVCATVNAEESGKKLITKIDEDLKGISSMTHVPRVLFIYARGAGTLMVAGDGTQMQKMISLSGADNAVNGFPDFKPLTPEALLEANPDVILMFESGVESLEGENGIWSIPGMADTKAGKTKQLVVMDGLYVSGFGPRLGQAVTELNKKLISVNQTSN
ncbi:MAG TPA: hemin ABC transporter substrate-binding protein [Flavobacteriales bacterium]|nr:hemin ABC transporter substrate-binding protein [Flavobacteriales bacterium]HCA83830.1 hemin ABC transporter substrate-binding protein [Flavobacteriales bacterium]HRE74295.1 ABC transporter substrate-binding protein [Flavobacteriales bacterium]HRE98853.1 ABC transporter substrate-binding protein [Flavobacteriales bacterium]HRJ36171.1 ABC transporter substrate-binding protein [Flavobacteriales bacterium]